MSARLLLVLTLLAVAAISLGVMAAEQIHDDVSSCGPWPSSSGSYTAGSQYEKNLAELLAALSSAAAAGGNGSLHVHSGSAGAVASPDQAWGLAMCYADSAAARCQDCLRSVASIGGLTELCPLAASSRSMIFFDSDACLLRYADKPFLGSAYTNFLSQRSSPGFDDDVVGVADMAIMNATRWRLLSQLAEAAAGHDQRFAYGSQEYTAARNGGGSPTTTVVYGLAQCTGDLEPRECTWCFGYLLGKMDMNNATRGSISVFSCYLRYQLNDPIHGIGVPAPAPQPAVPSSENSGTAPPLLGSEGSKAPLIAALAAAAGAVMLLVAGV